MKTTEQLQELLSVAEKAAEKIRHPDDCNCMAQFNRRFKPATCAELVREVLRLRQEREVGQMDHQVRLREAVKEARDSHRPSRNQDYEYGFYDALDQMFAVLQPAGKQEQP